MADSRGTFALALAGGRQDTYRPHLRSILKALGFGVSTLGLEGADALIALVSEPGTYSESAIDHLESVSNTIRLARERNIPAWLFIQSTLMAQVNNLRHSFPENTTEAYFLETKNLLRLGVQFLPFEGDSGLAKIVKENLEHFNVTRPRARSAPENAPVANAPLESLKPLDHPEENDLEMARMALVALDDSAISEDSADLLGFGDYADGLAGMLQSRSTAMPLVVSISAPWGAGKSTLAQLVARRIRSHSAPKAWHPDTVVEFNAWLHS
ncbi:MAG: KAP family NTPase, partial [Halobacteriales archaeon]|nr:KAP family NTPase [Halobacteriales archaeon]